MDGVVIVGSHWTTLHSGPSGGHIWHLVMSIWDTKSLSKYFLHSSTVPWTLSKFVGKISSCSGQNCTIFKTNTFLIWMFPHYFSIFQKGWNRLNFVQLTKLNFRKAKIMFEPPNLFKLLRRFSALLLPGWKRLKYQANFVCLVTTAVTWKRQESQLIREKKAV